MAPEQNFGYSFRLQMLRRRFIPFVALWWAMLSLAACDQDEIRVYTVAKEQPDAAPEAESSRPEIAYTVPDGWEKISGDSRGVVNFQIKQEGGDAMVNVTRLAGMAGRDGEIVNLWRQQVGQPALEGAEIERVLTPADIGGQPGRLFEIAGARGGRTMRIVTAFTHRDDGSWFFKLQGAEAVVAAQKPAFLEFLKTARVKDQGAPAVKQREESGSGQQFAWSVPDGWQPVTPGRMQAAKFALPSPDGTSKAEVAVSIFPNDTGGVLANVNRWRKQIGLPEIDEAGLATCVFPLEGIPDAVLADLTNGNKRLLGAIVPREGRWWFYKMTGDAPAVDPQREPFTRFVLSPP